jgi:hypothetical protein
MRTREERMASIFQGTHADDMYKSDGSKCVRMNRCPHPIMVMVVVLLDLG